MPSIENGWEYFTETRPGNTNKQILQENYLQTYNDAYKIFLDELLVPKPEEIKQNSGNSTKIKYIIDCSGESDVIKTNIDYPIKFLKSKFINNKAKKIKNDLVNYYKPHGFFVKGPYEIYLADNSSTNRHCIELCW
jgi:hypothetical protein